MVNGSQPPYVGFADTNAAALIGPGGYRMTPRLDRDEWHSGKTMLLSPDGRLLAMPKSPITTVAETSKTYRECGARLAGQA
jgi:hypothetical protein